MEPFIDRLHVVHRAVYHPVRHEQLSNIKALIMDRLNIIKPSAKADAEHEIDDFINNWKLLAAQPKGLKYYVFKTDKEDSADIKKGDTNGYI